MSKTVKFLRDEAQQAESDGCPLEAARWTQVADEIEHLTHDRDEINRKAIEQSELIQRDWAAPGQVAGMKAEIERLNQMIRETGQGQGAIDAYVAQCEEVHRLHVILSTPPTWLCADCRNQWIMRDEAEKQGKPKDNRNAAPLPPRQEEDGRLKCPGQDCSGIINKVTPERCPNCLQPLEKSKRP